MKRKTLTRSVALALALGAGATQALEVTGGFSGWWGQPDQENHGVILTVSRLPSGEKTAAVFWAIHDLEGQPSWLFAQGPIAGDTINATLYEVQGVTFMAPENPERMPLDAVGSMQIRFDDCRSGNVEFDTGGSIVGTGGFKIARLTNQPGALCSGGVSDDIDADDGAIDIRGSLLPTADFPGASGKIDYEASAARASLEIEIEDVPEGDYLLVIGGVDRGTITVTTRDDGDTEGEIEFESPAEPGKLLLDFDPLGQIVEIFSGSTLALEGLVENSGNDDSDDGNGDDDNSPGGDDEVEIEVEQRGLGAFPDGKIEAEFEIDDDRRKFRVEIEDIPVGSYTLVVDGAERATIEVMAFPDGNEGEVEFRDPAEPGKLLLDFDPRGTLVEITDAMGQVFSVNFPVESTEIDDDGSDDDGSDDDGSDDDGSDDDGSDDDGSDDDGSDDDGSDDDGSDDDGSDDDGSDDDGSDDDGSDDDGSDDDGSDDDGSDEDGSDDDGSDDDGSDNDDDN